MERSASDRSARETDSIEVLRLEALPAIGDLAFPLTHDYFGIVYAALVGPTAVLLARAMARHLESTDSPTMVCPVDLALEVGIRASSTDPLGKKSHLVHAIDRLAHDRIVVRVGIGTLGVRVAIQPVSLRTLRKLPAVAREAHLKLAEATGESEGRQLPGSAGHG